MGRPPSKASGPLRQALSKNLSVSALRFHQNKTELCIFHMNASTLWSFVSINRRIEDKEQGYQRSLSPSRVKAVADYIRQGYPITTSILISIPKGSFAQGKVDIPAGKDAGWVIDGQHRLAGAFQASQDGVDIELSVVAVLGEDTEFEIEQFITINREAKGVPTSIVYELLKHLPAKTKPIDVANERASELARQLRKEADSVFRGRIVVTTSPGPNQISLTNFVRKIAPLVHPERGLLNIYTFEEQYQIIQNYFAAFKSVFPQEWSKQKSIFFQTIGFGALMNVFDFVFKETLQRSGASFTSDEIVKVLRLISHFDFSGWAGTGNKAEIEAGNDIRVDLTRALQRPSGPGKRIRL